MEQAGAQTDNRALPAIRTFASSQLPFHFYKFVGQETKKNSEAAPQKYALKDIKDPKVQGTPG